MIPVVITKPDHYNCLQKYPALLLLHGFLSFKDGDGFLLKKIADHFARYGVLSARIDFCSMGENRCSRRQYGQEIVNDEARCAFKYLAAREDVDAGRVGVCGHSMGGKTTMMTHDLPSCCLIVLNGCMDISKGMTDESQYDQHMLSQYGCTLVETSDGRTEVLFEKFIEDARSVVRSDFDEYPNRTLFCIGKQDPTLPSRMQLDTYDIIKNERTDLITIENANHTYNAKTGDYTKVEELLEKMTPWIYKNLIHQERFVS